MLKAIKIIPDVGEAGIDLDVPFNTCPYYLQSHDSSFFVGGFASLEEAYEELKSIVGVQ